ncbi:NmrA family NAD(P)-binding protein [Sorangium sp. So ce1000]|uniref:NmrA family NAD(P)-binding protein n=1 Tax=Sorangium sp. So ce1000 TaxID=3133325 RepID=UPI003F615FAE
MSDRPILVTGAAGGTQGKTGRHVAEMLRKRGLPVRAFVRKLDERSEHLRELGAEVVAGDFLDFKSVKAAVEGVSAIYFAYPVQDGLLDATAIMAAAARQAGVTRLVDLEMLISSPDAPTPRMRQNYFSEQVFEWAQVGALHLRATVFYENLRELARTSLTENTIRLPWGNDTTLVPLVGAEDVARVAVGLLTNTTFAAGTAYPVVGQVISLAEIIATFGRVLGRDIRYEEVTDEEWRSAALARNFNPHAVGHLSGLWQAFRARGARSNQTIEVTPTIEKIGGAPPKTFEQFVRASNIAG